MVIKLFIGLFIVLAGCSIPASAAIVFEDNFSTLDTSKWSLYGSPQSRVLASAEGRTGVFDNNGDSWCQSGAVSKENFSFPNGVTLESDMHLKIKDVTGCWNSPWIGLTRQNTPQSTGVCAGEGYHVGVVFGIVYEGDACWGAPEEKRRHAYFNIGLYTKNGTWESTGYNLTADDFINEWHNYKIEIGSDRYVKFFVDNNLIHISENKIHPDVLQNKKIYLGRRSSDSAGKSYHDFIKVYETGPPSFVPYPSPLLTSYTVAPDSIFKLSDDEYYLFFVEQNSAGTYPADFNSDLLISIGGLNWDASSIHRNVISNQQSGHTFNYYVGAIKENNTYKTWHSATSDWDIAGTKLYYSTSTDGIGYAGHGLVLNNNPYPEYDSRNINYPWVVFDGTTYHLYYSAYPGHQSGPPDYSYHWTIAYATSMDGINWTKHGVVIDPGAEPRVIFDGTKFEMVYNILDEPKIGYAVSYDGLNWHKIGTLDSVEGRPLGLVKENNVYKIWYKTKNSAGEWELLYATTSANTQAGSPKVVTNPPITVTFSNVISIGQTDIISQTGNPGGSAPSGFRMRGYFVDVSTTATYTGPIEVCINYTGIISGNEDNLRLMHRSGSQWEDVTTSLDTNNNILCGQVTHLSWFGIASYSGVVGGIAEPVDKMAITAPYVVAAALLSIALVATVLRKK